MLIFLHMHKCAGSTVVRKARKANLRLPDLHRNGNLVDGDGTNVRYGGMSREDCRRLLEIQHAAGVEFFAMEWDFPPLEHLECGVPIEIFTVVRDPFERAVSNYRFAKLSDAVPPHKRFREMMNRSYTKLGPLARSSNYFTRKLCARGPLDQLTPSHLERALEVLGHFRSTIVLGLDDLDAELAKLGIVADVKPAKRTAELRLRRPDIPEEELIVSEVDRAWFTGENQLDIALVAMLRASRERGWIAAATAAG